MLYPPHAFFFLGLLYFYANTCKIVNDGPITDTYVEWAKETALHRDRFTHSSTRKGSDYEEAVTGLQALHDTLNIFAAAPTDIEWYDEDLARANDIPHSLNEYLPFRLLKLLDRL